METDLSDDIRAKVMESRSLAIWSIDESPLSVSYQTGRYFQDQGWQLYPIHDCLDRILDDSCYRDIRLIPDDYDILLLFIHTDNLPEAVNAIFNADFTAPFVWTHTGITDLEQFDRLTDAGVMTVMDRNLMEVHRLWDR